jgi:hypothetical protein
MIRIELTRRIHHFRLHPDSKLQAIRFGCLNDRLHSIWESLLIRQPISKARMVGDPGKLAVPEPTVIE